MKIYQLLCNQLNKAAQRIYSKICYCVIYIDYAVSLAVYSVYQRNKRILILTLRNYEGGSICNENPFITPSTNTLGLYVICQTKDQSVTVKMVHETLFYHTNFYKVQTF